MIVDNQWVNKARLSIWLFEGAHEYLHIIGCPNLTMLPVSHIKHVNKKKFIKRGSIVTSREICEK